MKLPLPRFLYVALPMGALSGLALANSQAGDELVPAFPPSVGRSLLAPTPPPGMGAVDPLTLSCVPSIRDLAGSGCIAASTAPTLGTLLPLSTDFNVSPSGQVSMGTVSPASGARLTVQQDGYGIQQRSSFGTDVTMYCDNLGGWLGTRGNFPLLFYTNNAGPRMHLSAAGNLGIGTGTPAARLHVSGTALVTGQTTLATTEIVSSNKLRFGAAGENTDDVYFRRYVSSGDGSVLELVLGDNPDGGAGNDAFIISTRNLDESNQQFRFQFNSNGDALKPGGGSWGVLSDRRAKHDIQPLAGALDKVLALAGKTYEYNDPAAPGAIAGECVGFIAQDVEQIFPEWVSQQADGTKTLTIRGFEALTVEALRDLRVEKDAAVARLESENAELRQRVEALEAVQDEVASLKAALATLAENR